MAKEQDTAENCFSGKFDNEVQIFLLKRSKNRSVGFAEQHELFPIRGSNAHCQKGYVVCTGNCQHCANDAIFALEKGSWTRGLMVYVLHRGKNDIVTLIFT